MAIASPTPMIKPPSRVSGNDWKPPSNAAPSPATVTTIVKVMADKPGERRGEHGGEPAEHPADASR